MRNFLRVVTLFGLVFELASCSNFSGGLRQDLDDRQADRMMQDPYFYPDNSVTGGSFPERGVLNNDPDVNAPPRTLTDEDRRLASTPVQNQTQERGLLNPYGKDPAVPAYSRSPNVPPPVKRDYHPKRVTKEDFVDSSQSEGSLWASVGQTNYFFVKNTIKEKGEIISLTVEDDLVKNAAEELKRALSEDEVLSELEKIADVKKAELIAQLPKSPLDRSPASSDGNAGKRGEDTGAYNFTREQRKRYKNMTDDEIARAIDKEIRDQKEEIMEKTPEDLGVRVDEINLLGKLDIKPGDVLLGEVLKRYNNGNYKIRVSKKVNYQNRPRILSLVGVAKAKDIEEKEMVTSGNLYEYRVKYF